MIAESDVRDQLRDWILNRANATGRIDLTDDMPIIDDGLLTSLDVVELILLIEFMRGEEVDIENIEPEYFASINSMCDAFFPPQNARVGGR